MKHAIYLLVMMIILAACSGPGTTNTPLPSATADNSTPAVFPSPTVSPALTAPLASPSPTVQADIFTQMGLNPPTPVCSSPIQAQTEGPYYKAGSPERNSLLEEGMTGTRMVLVGYVVDQNCNPLPNAWLDFWQADASGEYDNANYRLRGHQYADSQGRYYLETILPGLYASRPIEHIHVKVQPDGGEVVTSQLYFPNQPVDGLTVTIEERAGFVVGYFNFVIPR